ncbi:ABC transporter permease [Variovorax boronicumulans]|uniref:ABC transporter permease n=1 Tax=Variovorax boronicumulans TaxID=436515 RepID=UPI001C59DFFC
MSGTDFSLSRPSPAPSPAFSPSSAWKRRACGLLTLAAALALWQGATQWGGVDPAFMPSLAAVLKAFADLLRGGELAANLGATLRSGALGLGMGLVIGVPVGLWMATSRGAERFFNPLLKATYALPKTTLIPLLVLWFGVGTATNVVIVAVTSLLPIVLYTYRGACEVPTVLRWSAQSMGASKWTVLTRVLLPATVPAILIGLRIALGFAFLVVIACEMIVSNQGIGKLIFQYGDSGSYDYMFASLIVVVAVAYLSDVALVAFSDRALRWQEVSDGQR